MDYIDDMHLALPHQQQVGESNIDFKRFQYYLDMGASRTYKKVSENFGLQRGEYNRFQLRMDGKIEYLQ